VKSPSVIAVNIGCTQSAVVTPQLNSESLPKIVDSSALFAAFSLFVIQAAKLLKLLVKLLTSEFQQFLEVLFLLQRLHLLLVHILK